MNTKILAIAAVAAAALAGPSFAQVSPSPATPSVTPAVPSATPSMPNPAASSATMSPQTLNLKGHWRSSKLIGLDVYNVSNEKLGDINEIILDNTGKVTAVVIGVGGFLGMGEHDVAVSMDRLTFSEAPRPAPVASNAPASTTTTTSGQVNRPATATSAMASANDPLADWTPDHAVLNATRDQLKAIPQFKY